MKKSSRKLIITALSSLIVLFCIVPALSAEPTLENFTKTRNYSKEFSDISASSWYYGEVVNAYEHGLAGGVGGSKFSPLSNVTIAEIVTLAARVNCIYSGQNPDCIAAAGGLWYSGYANYALANGIINDRHTDKLEEVATRADVADILSAALPASEYTQINSIVAVPDVFVTADFYSSILLLYKAGITTGSDEYGSYKADTSIKRCEVIAMVNRLIDKNERKHFEPKLHELVFSPEKPVIYLNGNLNITLLTTAGYNVPIAYHWQIADKTIASVDKWGTFTGKATGITTLSAVSNQGKILASVELAVAESPLEKSLLDKLTSSSYELLSYKNDKVINHTNAVMLGQSGILITTLDAIRNSDKLLVIEGLTHRYNAFVLKYDESRNYALVKISDARFDAEVAANGNYSASVEIESNVLEAGAEVYAVVLNNLSDKNGPKVNRFIKKFTVAEPECVVGGLNLIKLEAASHTDDRVESGAMLVNSKGNLVGVMMPGSFAGDKKYFYAARAVNEGLKSTALISVESISEQIFPCNGTLPEKYMYIEYDRDYSTIYRGRTILGVFEDINYHRVFHLEPDGKSAVIELEHDGTLSGIATMTLYDIDDKAVAESVQTDTGLRLEYTLDTNMKSYYIIITSAEEMFSSAVDVSNVPYTLYFS